LYERDNPGDLDVDERILKYILKKYYVDWNVLAQNTDQWRALVNIEGGEFLD
jgi:hypothetical protein